LEASNTKGIQKLFLERLGGTSAKEECRRSSSCTACCNEAILAFASSSSALCKAIPYLRRNPRVQESGEIDEVVNSGLQILNPNLK
jgi:hypothetical protein